MSIFSTEFIATKIRFGALLAQYGWTTKDHCEQALAVGTATKVMETIAAPINAVAYFSPSRDHLAVLSGTCTSAGEDVMATMWMPVAHNVSDEDLTVLARAFAAEAHRCFGNASSVRLLRAEVAYGMGAVV